VISVPLTKLILSEELSESGGHGYRIWNYYGVRIQSREGLSTTRVTSARLRMGLTTQSNHSVTPALIMDMFYIYQTSIQILAFAVHTGSLSFLVLS